MIDIQDLCLRLEGFSLEHIDLSIRDNDFFALIGPTGSGKSLLLESLVGLRSFQCGRILINGLDVTRLPPERRELGIVYQDYALFPHLTVQKNIEYGLRYFAIEAREARRRFSQLTEIMGLGHLLQRKPGTLSGGEQQRVALARALICNPKGVLLDEPLSALDPRYQDEVKDLLKTLHQEWGSAFVLVSHNFSDVLSLAGRGAIIHQGRIEQQGSIQELFEQPNSCFCAGFVGMKNVLQARLQDRQAEHGSLVLQRASCRPDGSGYLAIRPEDIRPVSDAFQAQANIFSGRIAKIVNRGFQFEVQIEMHSTCLTALWSRRTIQEWGLEPGASVSIFLPPESLHTFLAGCEKNSN